MSELDDALVTLGLNQADYPNLRQSFDYSATLISTARSHLANVLADTAPPVDVTAFGSLGRREMTQNSDLDYLVMSYGLDAVPGTSRQALDIADQLRTAIDPQREFKNPDLQ